MPSSIIKAPVVKMNKVLIICGPTATGKTKLALQLAKEFNGELISADSRQVYVGNNIETGKDLHLNTFGIKIWLLDVVNQDEEFSVSIWRKLAYEAIENIFVRGKLPIVVGGSGLYIKSLVQFLPDIDIPFNRELRKKMENKSPKELFDYLKKINLAKAISMNDSDKKNPRRLIRAIEITKTPPSLESREGQEVSYVQIGLIASKDELIKRIKERVKQRGLDNSFDQKEINIMKKQLVWFAKQPHIHWFDVTSPSWQREAEKLVIGWYNQ